MHNVSQLYKYIIDEVIDKVKQEYLDEGYDASILQTLKTQWENKVNVANVYPTSDVHAAPTASHDYNAMLQRRQQEKHLLKREVPPMSKVPIETQRIAIPRPQQPLPPQRSMLHAQGLQQLSVAMVNHERQPYTQAAHLASQTLPQEYRVYPQSGMPSANYLQEREKSAAAMASLHHQHQHRANFPLYSSGLAGPSMYYPQHIQERLSTDFPAFGTPFRFGFNNSGGLSLGVGGSRPGLVPSTIAAESERLQREQQQIWSQAGQLQSGSSVLQDVSTGSGMMADGNMSGVLPLTKKIYILPKNNQVDGLPGESGGEGDSDSSDESADLIPASVHPYQFGNTPGPLSVTPMTSYSLTTASPNPNSVAPSKSAFHDVPEASSVEPPRKRSRKSASKTKNESGAENDKPDSIGGSDEEDESEDELGGDGDEDEFQQMLDEQQGTKKGSGLDRPHDDSDLDNLSGDDSDDLDGDGNKSKSDEEPLNSGDDVSDEETEELFNTPNVVVCQYEKVTRMRNKWKFHLKDGILHVRGKDYVFQRAQGEAQW